MDSSGPLLIEALIEGRVMSPLLPTLRGIGVFQARRDYIYRRHQHLDYELLIPIAGRYGCRLNGEPLELRHRQVLLVKPGDWHEDTLAAGVRYWAIQLSLASPGLLRGSTCFRAGIPGQAQICSPPSTALQLLLGRMREEQVRLDAIAMLAQDALLGQILALVARSYPPGVLAPPLLEAAEGLSFATFGWSAGAVPGCTSGVRSRRWRRPSRSAPRPSPGAAAACCAARLPAPSPRCAWAAPTPCCGNPACRCARSRTTSATATPSISHGPSAGATACRHPRWRGRRQAPERDMPAPVAGMASMRWQRHAGEGDHQHGHRT